MKKHTTDFSFFQEELSKHSTEIAIDIFESLTNKYPDDYAHLDDSELDKRKALLENLVYTVSLNLTETEEDASKIAVKWGEKIGEETIQANQPLSHYLQKLNVYKDGIWAFLENRSVEQKDSTDLFSLIRKIDFLFNEIVYGFSTAFTKNEKQQLAAYEEKYLKLSTPIVPIRDDIAIIPIIGEIDEKRARVLIDETLHEASKLDIEWLIIDLSGVYNVDDLFVSHLQKLLESIKILGITPILTGLRPDLSIRATHKGMNAAKGNEVLTKPNLKVAMDLLTNE